MSELKTTAKQYGIVKLILVRQYLFWSTLYVMLTEKVNWEKAQATIDNAYYTKALQSGEDNIKYRTPEDGEIGPQSRIDDASPFWQIIIVIVGLLLLLRKRTKK